MHVVLTVSGFTESGHEYNDRLGEFYTFPNRYLRRIQPGDVAVFYTGRRSYPGKPGRSYLGVAEIESVNPISELSTSGQPQHRAKLTEYYEFPNPVPLKIGKRYIETRANSFSKPGFPFMQGVRPLSKGEFDEILSLSGLT